jgi:hypothetical protein
MSDKLQLVAILENKPSHLCTGSLFVFKGQCDAVDTTLPNQSHLPEQRCSIDDLQGCRGRTCGGQPVPPAVWASSAYVKRGGKWFAASHRKRLRSNRSRGPVSRRLRFI